MLKEDLNQNDHIKIIEIKIAKNIGLLYKPATYLKVEGLHNNNNDNNNSFIYSL